MKTALKVSGLCLAGFILVGIIFAMALHHHDLNRVRQENRFLQQQIAEMAAHSDQLADENRRLSALIMANGTNPAALPPPDQSTEILRLRGEVGRLRLLEREAQQSRWAQMRAAQIKLTNAEVDLIRATQLHSENAISAASLSHARFTVELLKAEAKGDMVEAGRLRLRQAEEELARAGALRSQSLIGQAEYEQAARKVEATRAGNHTD